MSVLKTIKGTLQNVQQDITAGFKSLRVKENQAVKRLVKTDGVVLDAGADLLAKFQQSWVDIHQESEINAKKAQTVDSKVSYLFLACEQQNDAMNQLLGEVSTLPSLIHDITELMTNIGSLQAQFYEIEDLMVDIEDLCEQQEMQQNKKHHQYKLTTYKQLRESQLEAAKIDLAQEHAKKVKQIESRHKAKLKERQKTFDERFQEDVKFYQLFGKTERPPSVSSDVDIGDIKPEDDNADLDEFLQQEQGDDQLPDADPLKSCEDHEAPEVFEDDEALDFGNSHIVIKHDEQDTDDTDVEGKTTEPDNNAVASDNKAPPKTKEEDKNTIDEIQNSDQYTQSSAQTLKIQSTEDDIPHD